MIEPDDTTFAYLEAKPHVPAGVDFQRCTEFWKSLATDEGARFDRSIQLDVTNLAPQVSWGTHPAMVADVTGSVPDPAHQSDPELCQALSRALEYMDLRPGTPLQELAIDRMFIGSCTNSRIEDLRRAASLLKGRKLDNKVRGLAVPGSQQVKRLAEEEGLDRIFRDAGFEWRESGCSMCLGMNPDILQPGERCASTSNRNFEGRQGRGGCTHLVSPEMAAAAGVASHFVDIRDWVS